MPRKSEADIVREALEEEEPEQLHATLEQSPLELLKSLAAGASSETVRVQAARVLLDRQDAQRDRRRETASCPRCAEVARMSSEQLAAETDGHLAAIAALAREEPSRFPQTAAVLEEAVDRRAAELADAERIEAEIARRVEERAAQLEPVPAPEEPEEQSSPPPVRRDAPPGLEPADLWPGRRAPRSRREQFFGVR